MKESYTPEEVDAIMRRAIENSPMPGTMTRAQVEQIAADVGVSKDALARAESALATQAGSEGNRELFQSFLAWRSSEFRTSMMVRGAIIAFLLGLGAVLTGSRGPGGPPEPFVIGSLGVGLSMLISWAKHINSGGLEHSPEFAEWLAERSHVLRKVTYLRDPRGRRREYDDDDDD